MYSTNLKVFTKLTNEVSQSNILDEDMREEAVVNQVAGITMHSQFVGDRFNKGQETFGTVDIDANELKEFPSNIQRYVPDTINAKNIKSADTKPKKHRDRNLTEQLPTRGFNTLLISRRLRLEKTDNIRLDLSKVRLEAKGTLESKYEILYTLGNGSYGKVLKIRDKQTDELKAVKIISKERCSTLYKYNEEIEILKKLANYVIIIGSPKCSQIV